MRLRRYRPKCGLKAAVRIIKLSSLLLLLSGIPVAAQRPSPPPPPPPPPSTCELPAARPWEFLDASNQIQFIPDTTSTKIFRAVQFADLNKDGQLDVIETQAVSAAGVTGTPYPSVLYMNENGRFMDRTAQYIPSLATPQVRWWVVPHDFVGPLGPPDGWIDLYVGRGGGKPAQFFRNLGVDTSNQWLGFQDESWRIQSTSGGRGAMDSYHQHKADLDGDGWMDVVEYPNGGAGAGQIRAMMNRDGTFVDETVGRLPLRSEPSLFGHVEDLSGDGKPDISVANLKPANGVPQVRVLINDGTGHFPSSLEQTLPQPTSTLGVYGLDHVDVNGDGKLDIYVVNFGKGSETARDVILLNVGTGNQLFNTLYYPEFPTGSSKDSDGDHPVGADFDGDGRIDIATAQFAAGTFVLRNQTCNGVTKLVDATPAEVPTGAAFRLRTFDANGDGAPDLWIGRNQPNVGNFLMIGNVPELEPNETHSGANPTTTFAALRTGAVSSATDVDVFSVPNQAVNDGATFVLKPVAGTDLELALLDETGNVLAISGGAGTGGAENIDLAPGGTGSRYLRVAVQGILGTGVYRLSMSPSSGSGGLSTSTAQQEDVPEQPGTRR